MPRKGNWAGVSPQGEANPVSLNGDCKMGKINGLLYGLLAGLGLFLVSGEEGNKMRRLQKTATTAVQLTSALCVFLAFMFVGKAVAQIPAAPTAAEATSITATGFTANWGLVDGAAGYYLDVATGAVIRNLPDCYKPTAGLSVSITVTPDGTTQAYAVEDSPPMGWVVSIINESGGWDGLNNKVKWGPFFDHAARTLTYQITAPEGEAGEKTFSGTASFDGTDVTVGGDSNIDLCAAALPFPFTDDFSADKGWIAHGSSGWERGPAVAGGGEEGNPDPGFDHTSTDDNHVLGFVIGGDYPNNLEESSVISPPIDCTGQDKVLLKFWRYLNVEGNKFDHASISVSSDGINWVPIWQNPESAITDSQWTPVAFDISQLAGNQGSVYIKFSMGPTNSIGRYSGWNIDDLEVTSNPVYPAEGTMGTEFTITGSGLGTKRGKVSIGTTSVTILDWKDGLISCRLNKVLPPATYDVKVLPGTPNGSPPITHKEAFEVKPPEIDLIDQNDGTAWDEVTVQGKFFGTKQGRVYLESHDSGSNARTICSVLGWKMDPVSGESQVIFVVPSLSPETYDVVIDPYGVLPDTQKEDGFTVKAPVIDSVDQGINPTGKRIGTIRGRFFGTKRGKIYLGYVGGAKRKSCSVRSWNVVDPTTEEGEIVFIVPKGLPFGTYDLIITNGVASVTESARFTIE